MQTVLLADGQAPVTRQFAFHLAERDRERLRWYLEDYLDHPFDPYPTIAAGVEAQMRTIGRELFEKVFWGSEDARSLWARLRPTLADTRIEIATGVRAAAVPNRAITVFCITFCITNFLAQGLRFLV